MLVKGDKIIAKKSVLGIVAKGEICEVHKVIESEEKIQFKFGNGLHMGIMSFDEYKEFFEKYEERKSSPSVTKEYIEAIMNHSKVIVNTMFDKCTVVSVQLPNGFVIVESSACVSPENYNKEVGVELCMNKIINKVWELEGYRLQQSLYEASISN